MILTDLTQHNRKNLKEQDALSIARSCQKHLSHLASMGYAAGAVREGERAIVTVTTPQGRRFEVAVREITIQEEIEKNTAFGTIKRDLDDEPLAPIGSQAAHDQLQRIIAEARDLPPVAAPPPEGPVARLAQEARTGVDAVITGKAKRVLAMRGTTDGKIDGEYVYRNYAVSMDGRTWETLTPEERLSWDDRARRLVAASGGLNA